jgi:hypothetical protein
VDVCSLIPAESISRGARSRHGSNFRIAAGTEIIIRQARCLPGRESPRRRSLSSGYVYPNRTSSSVNASAAYS